MQARLSISPLSLPCGGLGTHGLALNIGGQRRRRPISTTITKGWVSPRSEDDDGKYDRRPQQVIQRAPVVILRHQSHREWFRPACRPSFAYKFGIAVRAPSAV